MLRKIVIPIVAVAGVALVVAAFLLTTSEVSAQDIVRKPEIYRKGFEVDVLVNGRTAQEYHARGKTYIEAVNNEEYEISITNPLPYRVAVALSVDGMNSIDARRTSAWSSSKWVIGPYETIHVGGWQMSSNRARRFYFTNERDSYGAKLGQTGNFGVISAVFFREIKHPVPITPRPMQEEGNRREKRSDAPSSSPDSAKSRGESMARVPDDEYAATGIGRSVQNDVHWVNMNLDSRPLNEVTIRYEYYSALVKLGVLPRPYPHPDVLQRREAARGFEDRRFSPEP